VRCYVTQTGFRFFGAARGTGKSFVPARSWSNKLSRLVGALWSWAPQRQQVVEMEQAGLPAPATVASFPDQA